MLPRQGVRWEPIDETSARATFSDAGITLSMVVHIDGMMIPVAGEVEWILPEGRFAFWRVRITDAEYEYAQ